MTRTTLLVAALGLILAPAVSLAQATPGDFPQRPIGSLAETGMKSTESSRRVALANHVEETVPVVDLGTAMAVTEIPTLQPMPLKPMKELPPPPPVAAPLAQPEFQPAPTLSAQSMRSMSLRTKITAPEASMIKQRTSLHVDVTNDGQEASETAVLKVHLPSHLVMESADPAATTCRDGVVEFSIGALPSQANQRITLNVIPQTCDPVSLKTELLMASRQEVGFQIARPTLDVEVIAPEKNYLEGESTYLIRICNSSPVELTAVEVEAFLPEGMQVISADCPPSLNHTNKTLKWSIEKLGCGQTQTFQCLAKAKQAGSQVCRVKIHSDESEPVNMEVATVIHARAHLKVGLCSQTSQIQVGQNADLEISLENRGTDAAREIAIQLELPLGLQPNPSHAYRIEQGRLLLPTMELSPGESKTIAISCTGTLAGEHVVRAQFQSSTQRAISVEDTVFVYETGSGVAEPASPSGSHE